MILFCPIKEFKKLEVGQLKGQPFLPGVCRFHWEFGENTLRPLLCVQ